MSDRGGDRERESREEDLSRTIGRKALRRVRARRNRDRGVWFGLGMFGMVGWTVTLTTLIGLAVGMWIDRTWPGPYSWTLMMFFAGLALGCANAWYWVRRESHLGDEEDDGE